jgi:predicted XRE-type DNA-binding protein
LTITRVRSNNHQKCVELQAGDRTLTFPYARLFLQPAPDDPVEEIFPDPETGCQAFTYRLRSGKEDTIHLDHVLDFNGDPAHKKRMLVYQMTLEARKAVARSPISKREIIRRLGTSASQFYRLLDPANQTKSLGQLVELVSAAGQEVEFVVREPEPACPNRPAS